jgi:predicted aminopeptidase
LPALLAALALAGCAPPGYYLQAAEGHFELWRLARPLEDVQGDPLVPASLQERLAAAASIRDFASRELALPDNGSYRRYAALDRSYVVWNVLAAEEFSVRPKEWCFPVAGCVGYRGYFSRREADAFVAALREQGLDAHVGGVPAYSTLGWFDDPLLSTFIHYPDTDLARLMFHELSHQVAYARDDTEFNESFAVVVEQEGLRRWLTARNNEAMRRDHERAQRMRADFLRLVLDARSRLETVYASPLPDEEKRREKARVFASLRSDYDALKAGPWRGYAGYDRWLGQEINNATLASVGLYQQLVPAFEVLLEHQGRDLPRFYAEVKALADLPREERRRRLDAYCASRCNDSSPRGSHLPST